MNIIYILGWCISIMGIFIVAKYQTISKYSVNHNPSSKSNNYSPKTPATHQIKIQLLSIPLYLSSFLCLLTSTSALPTLSQLTPRSDFNCPSPGVHANPASCGSFYNCAAAGPPEVGALTSCPAGLGWNDSIKTCDYLRNNPCGASN